MGREEEIGIIAYRIWEEEGYCHGRDIEHWLRAERIWEEMFLASIKGSTNGAYKGDPCKATPGPGHLEAR